MFKKIYKNFSGGKLILSIFLFAVPVFFMAYHFSQGSFNGPFSNVTSYVAGSNNSDNFSDSEFAAKTKSPPTISPYEKIFSENQYIETPDAVKAIYMTACVAATPSFRQNLVKLIKETELNSIIIDIKDFSGTISFNLPDVIFDSKEDSGREISLAGENASGCRASDMVNFVKQLKDEGIYVIGRVTVFQDPYYAKLYPELAVKKESDKTQIWQDYKKINFIDVSAHEYWDYIMDLVKASHQVGFDEINFDYIRFPSDGDMKDIYFEHSAKILADNPPTLGKQIALENYFKYLKEEVNEYNKSFVDVKGFSPLVTSADLFGMVTTNKDDLNIGQVLERALPYFDYIAPMVYPSHYPPNFNGWKDPNKVPYELIHYVMGSAVQRVTDFDNATTTPEIVREHVSTEQLRPWIQDFDYGGVYDVAEVRAQIQATYDVGLDSWMIWAPSNRYTRGALKDAE